jgi:hypothetical protein
MTSDVNETATLESKLELLHEYFLRELERQESVLAICRAQSKAALRGDTDSLQSLTQSLVELIQGAMRDEARRHESLRAVVAALGLPEEEHTLSLLIERVPSAWRKRFREFQVGIRTVMDETRRTTRVNRRYFLHSARLVNESMSESVGSKPGYTSRGSMPGLSSLQAMLLNAAG